MDELIYSYINHTSIHPSIDWFQLIHLFVHPSIHPSIYPSIRLPIHPLIHIYIKHNVCTHVYPFSYLSVHSTIRPPIHPSIPSLTYSSIHLSIHPSVYLSVRPSIRLSLIVWIDYLGWNDAVLINDWLCSEIVTETQSSDTGSSIVQRSGFMRHVSLTVNTVCVLYRLLQTDVWICINFVHVRANMQCTNLCLPIEVLWN